MEKVNNIEDAVKVIQELGLVVRCIPTKTTHLWSQPTADDPTKHWVKTDADTDTYDYLSDKVSNYNSNHKLYKGKVWKAVSREVKEVPDKLAGKWMVKFGGTDSTTLFNSNVVFDSLIDAVNSAIERHNERSESIYSDKEFQFLLSRELSKE